jgi:hypothetical protein
MATAPELIEFFTEVVRGEWSALLHAITPTIVFTPLDRDKLAGRGGGGYPMDDRTLPGLARRFPDEVGCVGLLPIGPTERSSAVATS